jgi:hypothetical protein
VSDASAAPPKLGIALTRDFSVKLRETVHYWPITRTELDHMKALADTVTPPDQWPANLGYALGSTAVSFGTGLFFGHASMSTAACIGFLAITIAAGVLTPVMLAVQYRMSTEAEKKRSAFHRYMKDLEAVLAARYTETEKGKKDA